MTTIQIPEGELQTALSTALLSSLSEQGKADVIGQAIAYLNKPMDRGYGNPKRTPLQEAFETAVNSLIHRLVREYIENDVETRALIDGQVEELLGDLRAQLVGENRDQVRAAVVATIIDKLADQRAGRWSD